MTFDAWELSIRPSNDYLAHHGIPGMKHGRNRYQNEDGTWTEEGLRRRRQREGWGEGKEERRAQKAVAKAEKKEARKASRAATAESIRKRKLKNLTDEELQAKIDRLKKEREYKELKKSPYVEIGANLINKYLEYRSTKEQRSIEASKQKIEMERLKTQQIQSKNQTEQSKNRIKTSEHEAKKAQQDAKKAFAEAQRAKTERKANLLQKKMEYKNTTIRGGLAKRVNILLTAGKAKQLESIRKGKGDAEANRLRAQGDVDSNMMKVKGAAKTKQYASDSARNLANRQYKQARADKKKQRTNKYKDSFEKMKEDAYWKKRKASWLAGHT